MVKVLLSKTTVRQLRQLSFSRFTVNVLKLRTLKNNYFSVVRNFRNYVFGKMPVFEILECGLYQEKNGIYACQNVVETC